MKKTLLAFAALISALAPVSGNAMTPSKGRIVVFADKKDGVLKTDLSIKVGTFDDLKNLRLVDSQKGVHACFVGKPENIKPLLESMVASTNKSTPADGLVIKSFERMKDSTIHVEVTAQDPKQNMSLNIGPC